MATKAEKEAAAAAKKAEKEAAAKAAAETSAIPQDARAPKAGEIIPEADSHDGIDVGDPEILKPKTLPLVVKPAGKKDEDLKDLPNGGWKNAEQSEYARGINAYAYKNPAKFGKKKNVLVARLAEIGNDPSKLSLYKGVSEDAGSLKFTDKRLEGKQ